MDFGVRTGAVASTLHMFLTGVVRSEGAERLGSREAQKECEVRMSTRDSSDTLARRQGTVSGNERGAALMIVLVVLVGLTALAAAGLALTETELRSSENQAAGTNAFYVADAGLQQYLGTRYGVSTDTFTYAAGSAIVEAEQLLELPTDRILYRVRTVSTYSPPEGGTASRTISRLALFDAGTITAKASFAAGAGLLKNGGAGTISGADYASAGDPNCPNSPAPMVAGVAVPPGGYVQDGGGLVPDGDPEVYEAPSSLELLEETGVPWEKIVNEGLVEPDYLIPPDTWPLAGSYGSDEWPVIYVDGSASVTPDHSGHGTIIVRDNLTLGGDFTWQGLVLVGGYLTSNGYQTIEGATVTGLNELLGEATPSSDLGNGNKAFRYHSCNLTLASRAAFGGLSEVPGSWFERWQ